MISSTIMRLPDTHGVMREVHIAIVACICKLVFERAVDGGASWGSLAFEVTHRRLSIMLAVVSRRTRGTVLTLRHIGRFEYQR